MAKHLKAKDLREKSMDELKKELLALQREFFNLRVQHAVQSMPNHTQLGRVKKDVARVLTIIREKEDE